MANPFPLNRKFFYFNHPAAIYWTLDMANGAAAEPVFVSSALRFRQFQTHQWRCSGRLWVQLHSQGHFQKYRLWQDHPPTFSLMVFTFKQFFFLLQGQLRLFLWAKMFWTKGKVIKEKYMTGKVRCLAVVRRLTFTCIFIFRCSRVLMIFNGVLGSAIFDLLFTGIYLFMR